MAENEIRVTFPGGLRVDAQYKGFIVKTDQPVYDGGEGTMPSSFDYFLTSIATCAGFYTVAFCRERGIPTEKAGVVMRWERDPETRRVGKIWIEIQLPAEFPDKYKRAVVKAVDSCSVKIHILNPPVFEIEAKISG
ncbi:MAG: OsmC family protein [Acidobacteriota bacterium]